MTNAKAILLAYLVLVGMIVSPPVMAASYTLTGFQEFNVLDVEKDMFTGIRNLTFDKALQDKAISLIHFKAPQDHTVYFTIWYGTGSSVGGSVSNVWNISIIPPTTTTSTITFDGVSTSYSYFDTNPEWDYYLSGYARNNDNNATGMIVYHAGYGSFDDDLAVFKEVEHLGINLIYKVDLWCDAPFDADISYGTKSEIAASVEKSIIEVVGEWVDFALALGTTLLGFVLMLVGLIKFFFVDNLLTVIALWFGVTMAYSAISTKNIFAFYTKFFRYQRALLDFIVQLWNYLIQIISSFRGIFRI